MKRSVMSCIARLVRWTLCKVLRHHPDVVNIGHKGYVSAGVCKHCGCHMVRDGHWTSEGFWEIDTDHEYSHLISSNTEH